MLANNDCTSPLFKNVVSSGAFGKAGMVTDLGLPLPDTWTTTANQQNDRLSNKPVDHYMQPSRSPDFSFDVVSNAEYPSGRIGSRAAVSNQRVPSNLENRAFRGPTPRYDDSFRADPKFSLVDNFEKIYGANALRAGETDDVMLEIQTSRRRGDGPGSVAGSAQAAALDGHRESFNNHANQNPSVQTKPKALSLRSSRSNSKQLRWVGTGDGDKADDPEMAATRNVDENSLENGHNMMRSNRGGSETASTGFTSERNNAGLLPGHSWRHERDDPNGLGQQLPRSPSDESDRTSDRASDVYYPNRPVSVGDYEPSETSSTTMEEMDDATATSFRSVGRGSPQSESGIPRHIPRPSIRSNASTGTYHSARSSVSDDSNLLLSNLELVSPDLPLKNGRLGSLRTQSWEERLEPSGMSPPAGSLGPADRAMSVRHRPQSSEHGPREPLVRVSSDPSAGWKSKRGYNVHDTARRPIASNSRPNAPHQQWPVPPTPYSSLRAPSGHRWTSNSPRTQFSEQSPMHYQQSGPPTYPLRPSNRLPPRTGHYPPLPPRGALQRVDCQHCDIQLVVPSKLPPSRTNIQKLRCGSCRRVSQYTVVLGDDAVEVSFPNSDSHHSH